MFFDKTMLNYSSLDFILRLFMPIFAVYLVGNNCNYNVCSSFISLERKATNCGWIPTAGDVIGRQSRPPMRRCILQCNVQSVQDHSTINA